MRGVFLLGALVTAALATVPACSNQESAATSETDAGRRAVDGSATNVATSDAAPSSSSVSPDAGIDAAQAIPKGPPPSALPVSYQRADEGTPLTAAELATATDELIAILKDTRYFDAVDERIHGFPEDDPAHGYSWGAMWTGITLTKSGGVVTYKHNEHGSDNAGIHTAPYLESACYAHLLWGEAKTAHLVRRIARGFIAWIRAMQPSAVVQKPRILARTFYPPSYTTQVGGTTLSVDTSASRPGVNSEPADFVHFPTNPFFGDIYVKNRRSKDDMGHMLRAIAQSEVCAPRMDADAQADMAELASLYADWGEDVDGRGFVIPTRDATMAIVEPTLQLAHYQIGATALTNVECVGALAVRLAHGTAAGNLDCGSGLGGIESGVWSLLQDDARQIMRTHHSAAAVEALQKNPSLGLTLLQGLGDRVSLDTPIVTGGAPPSSYDVQDVAGFMAYAASAGVPLKSSEVRFLHARIHQAFVGMRDPSHTPSLHVFEPSVPDGTYAYDLPNEGFYHFDLGLLLGACASPLRNPSGRPVLDCARLQAAF
ncbi:MAG: hypothetical protein U0235_24000 [Polyangiaceae bacterium]